MTKTFACRRERVTDEPTRILALRQEGRKPVPFRLAPLVCPERAIQFHPLAPPAWRLSNRPTRIPVPEAEPAKHQDSTSELRLELAMTIAWSITCAVLVPVACLGLVLWLEHLEDSLAEALQGLAAGDVQGSLLMAEEPEPSPPEEAPVTASPAEAVPQCDDSWNLAATAN